MLNDPGQKSYLQYISLGTEIAVVLGGPILAGFWLDSLFETSPYLTLAGVLFAVLLFIIMLVRLIRKFSDS